MSDTKTVLGAKAVQTQTESKAQAENKRPWTKGQLAAIALRGKNIIVSASAGSGKTSVMIERVAGLIAEGYSLSDMLVVTFTRAAASDIKDKLARRLSASHDPHIRSQLKQISDADIGTLHSWCQRLSARYFYLVGLDPDFSVLEEDSAGLFDECMNKVIDGGFAAEDQDFLRLLDILGGRDETALKAMLSDFYHHLKMRPDFAIDFEDEDAKDRLLAVLAARKSRLLSVAQQLRQDTCAAGFARNTAAADELVTAIESNAAPTAAPRGKIPREYTALNDRYKKIKENAKIFAHDYQEAAAAPPADNQYLQVLLRMAKQLDTEFLQCKKSQAKADFGDLEHYALDILRSSAGQEIRSAYKFIFVDEYQDINPLQNAIIDKLCSGNNLFLVGDLKQSIYAFRGCEPTIFLQKIKDFAADSQSEVIELSRNHRSDKGVLDFVNKVFCRVMTPEFGGTDYYKSGRFVFDDDGAGGAESSGAVTDGTKSNGALCEKSNTEGTGCSKKCAGIYLYRSQKQTKAGIYDLLSDTGEDADMGADLVAARILQLLGEKVVESGKARDARFGDIAVLFRSGGAGVHALVKKLERLEIPVSVCDSLRPQSGAVIAELVGYLRLIDNRQDDIALIGALKSCFGGFSDGELAAIRLAYPKEETFTDAALLYAGKTDTEPDILENEPNKLKNEPDKTETEPNKKESDKSESESRSLAKRLSQFFAVLDGYRRLSCAVSTEELIGCIVTDFNYFQQMFLRGGTYADQLEAFLDFASGKAVGLSEFLQAIPKKFPAGSAVEDAVLIMTIHSAKGLEFPFVILPEAQKRFNLSDLRQPVIVFGQLAAIKHFDWDTRTALPSAGWLHNRYQLHRRQREEEMRLLYVGLTRAKQSVDIFAEADENEDFDEAEDCGSFLGWLMPFASGYGRSIAPAGELPKKAAVFPPPDPQLLDSLRRRINYQIPISDLPPKTYVTALLGEDEGRVVLAGGESDDRAMLTGTLYHKAMELVDFDKDFDDEWGGLSEEIKQAVDKESIRIACQKTARLLKGHKIFKEQSFMLDAPAALVGLGGEGSVLVQGVIDLLAEKDGKAVVVDYKTGGINSKYKKQLELYALAVQRILGIAEVKKLIYSFAAGDFLDADLL